jgi:hypothetical protein
MHNTARVAQHPDGSAVSREILETLRRIEQQNAERDRRFDEFARTFLNAKFPYGKAEDRWRS